MQEPNVDKDDKWCHRINEIIKHPPTNFLTEWYRLIFRERVNLHMELKLLIQQSGEQGRFRLLNELYLKRMPIERP